VNETDLGMVCPWPGIRGSTHMHGMIVLISSQIKHRINRSSQEIASATVLWILFL